MTHSTRFARSGRGRTAAAVVLLFGVAVSAGAQTKPAPPKPAQPTTAKPTPARPAAARRGLQPPERFYISVNGAFQSAGDAFGERVSFVENAENGSFSTDYTVDSGPAFNISVGAGLWRNLGVGVGVTRYSKNTPIELTASVPHPFFFNRARSVSSEIGGLKREELAVHIQARATLMLRPRLRAVLFAGPSFFSVKQGIVNDFEVTEAYPYDTVAFSRGVTRTADESKVGGNVGVDVGYFLTRQLGVGGTVQWSGTTIETAASSGTGTLDIKAGGVQAGLGLRLRF